MPVTWRWVLTDPFDNSTYTFEMNPNADGSPQAKKTIAFQSTAAPNGNLIMYEGRDQPPSMTFTGTFLTQAQYHNLYTWFGKRHPIWLTDDLGRQFLIYITDFQPKRKLSRQFPWRHDYTVVATVLQGQ